MTRIYTNNDFQGGTLLNRYNFENQFPFVYFNLPNLEDNVDPSFHYELSGDTDADYIIYVIVLHEKLYNGGSASPRNPPADK